MSLWAELTGAVPTQAFILHQLRVLQGVVGEVGKDLGAKGLAGKEIKAGPCCRDGKGLKEPPITAEGGEWCHHQKEQTAGGFGPLHCIFFHCWTNSHLLGIASLYVQRN